jgi:hypothetical protein
MAIRWFVGFGLQEALPDRSSLTRIRQRWGAERFRKIFERTVNSWPPAPSQKPYGFPPQPPETESLQLHPNFHHVDGRDQFVDGR